jgi:AP-1 complex subunit gamma-1
VIGEYADALLRGADAVDEEDVVRNVKESDVVDLFMTILNSSYSGQVVTQYIITAAMKLTTRLNDPAQIERIRRLLQSNQTNLDVEIQQRAVEYSNLFAVDSIRRGVLEKMPPPEIREEQRVLGEAPKKQLSSRSRKPKQVTEQDMLLDLMSDDSAPSKPINGSQNNADLLMDILGGGPSSTPANESGSSQKSNVDAIMGLFGNSSASPAPTQSSSASNDLLGGLGGTTSTPPASSVRSPPPTSIQPAYNKNGLQIGFQLQRSAAGIQAIARFRNTGGSSLSSVSLQAAVPKTQKLQLQSISTTDLGPGAEATQQLRIISVQGVSNARLINKHPLT